MQFLSRKIGREYKRLARNLEMEDEVIDEIESKKCRMEEKCRQIFLELKRLDGYAEWTRIKRALEAFDQIEIISEFLSEYTEFV